MILNVLSPEKILFEKLQVNSVILPGAEGIIELLEGHAEMLGTLNTGIVKFNKTENSEDTLIAVSTGFFKVKQNEEGLDEITIMAETAETSDEIDFIRAQKAQKKAEIVLSDGNSDPDHFNKHQLKLQRALIRQQVATRSF
jgi:F-type H+-transporting ATPase subunit epsilon